MSNGVYEEDGKVVIVGKEISMRRKHKFGVNYFNGSESAVEMPRDVFMEIVRKLVVEEMVDKEI